VRLSVNAVATEHVWILITKQPAYALLATLELLAHKLLLAIQRTNVLAMVLVQRLEQLQKPVSVLYFGLAPIALNYQQQRRSVMITTVFNQLVLRTDALHMALAFSHQAQELLDASAVLVIMDLIVNMLVATHNWTIAMEKARYLLTNMGNKLAFVQTAILALLVKQQSLLIESVMLDLWASLRLFKEESVQFKLVDSRNIITFHLFVILATIAQEF
jgi:hypothetical protein